MSKARQLAKGASLVALVGSSVSASDVTAFVALNVTPPEGCWICVTDHSGSATAFAFIITEATPINGVFDADVGTPYDDSAPAGLCLGGQHTAAMAGASDDWPCGNSAFAASLVSAGGNVLQVRADLRTDLAKSCLLCPIGGNRPEDCEELLIVETAGGLAETSATFEFRCSSGVSRSVGTATLSGSVTIPDAPVTNADGRVVAFVAGSQGCALHASFERTVSGDRGDGLDIHGDLNQSGPCGSTSLSLTSDVLYFSDAQFDLDGNGRFNERDWPLIESLLGSSNPSDLARFNVRTEPDLNANSDLTDDQVISQVDLDLIRASLDAGLGAGDLGDVTGDGKVTCADLAAIPTSLNAVIGDVLYEITLDADLDGDNDASDLAAVLALFPTADVATPFGTLDLVDLTTFITWFNANDPRADIAPPYAVFDATDLNTFTAEFNTPCP